MRMDERGKDWPFDVERLKKDDECEFRFEAAEGWHPGIVVKNGGAYYWVIRDQEGKEHSFWIECIRCKGAGEGMDTDAAVITRRVKK